jgi:hypothetical protein
MRAIMLIAILTIAGTAAADAADVHLRKSGGHRAVVHYHPVGKHAPPLTVYDYEPGTVTRAYWLPPWRHRHYFPFGLAKWERKLTRVGGRARPARPYHRYWSTSQLYAQPGPDAWDVDAVPLPPPDRRRRIP